ncbi:1805_t:CDS:2, partial [Gigaspora rosea]
TMQDKIPQNEQNTKDSSLLSPTYSKKQHFSFVKFHMTLLTKDNTINTDSSQPYTGEKEQSRGFGAKNFEIGICFEKHEKPPKIEKKSNKLHNAKKPSGERQKALKNTKFGDVEDIIFPIEEGKNIAHITFKTERDAAEGLKRLDGHIFHESKMHAKFLAEKISRARTFKIFSAHGKVVEINLPRKHPNVPLRGFTYIQYKKVDEAERDKYLEAMKSQQGKHDYEQNNDHDIDSYDVNTIIYKSVLTADPSNSQAHKFTLHGRVLSIVKAVDRDEAHRLTEENKNKKQREDR